MEDIAPRKGLGVASRDIAWLVLNACGWRERATLVPPPPPLFAC